MIIEENELFLFPAFSILNISEPNHSEEQGYIWRIFVKSCFLIYDTDFQEDKKEAGRLTKMAE